VALQEVKEALALGEPFSLIISDWQMPGMDGITLLRKLRQQEETRKLPFMLLTGLNDKPLVLEAIEAGVSSYLSKPFSPGLFEQKIGEMLDAPVLRTPLRRLSGR
jgi:two-component system chemotaxis response regulator CheY